MKKKENNNCGIYCWENLKTNKRYIGQSTDLKERKRTFLRFNKLYCGNKENKRKTLIDNARFKYPDKKYWKYTILKYCTIDELNSFEQFFISIYESNNRKYGYNLNNGGGGNSGFKMPKEAVEIIRERSKNRIRTIEERKKISDFAKTRIGEKNPNFGNHCSEETKLKIAKHFYKPILQFDLEGNFIKEWEGISIASKELNIERASISANCRKINKVAKGYIFKYKDDLTPIEIPDKNIYHNTIIKNICQYDLKGNFIKKWKSITEIENELGFCRESIYRCLSKKQKTAFKSVWLLEDEEFKLEYKPKIEKGIKILQIDIKTKEIIKEWCGIYKAAEYLNIHPSNISVCLKENNKTAGGYFWCYSDNTERIKELTFYEIKRKVYQLNKDTEEIINIFDSIKDAERFLNVTRSKISECCRNKRKTTLGFKWRYAS